MRSILSSSAFKRLSLFAALSAALMTALCAIAIGEGSRRWSVASREYSEWTTGGKGARCAQLLVDAEPYIPPSRCKTSLECLVERMNRRDKIEDKFRAIGCPIDWRGGPSREITTPFLDAPEDPGQRFAYVRSWVESRVLPIALKIASVLVSIAVALFLLTRIIRDFLLEPHLGWRRLTIVSSVIAAFAVPAIYAEELDYQIGSLSILSLASLIGSVAIIIYGRRVSIWVYSGFRHEVSSVATPALRDLGGQATDGGATHTLNKEQRISSTMPPAYAQSHVTTSEPSDAVALVGALDRPSKVAVAVMLLYSSLGIGVVRTIAEPSVLTGSNPVESLFGEAGAVVFAVAVLFVVYSITWCFIQLIGRGINWARVTFLVVFIAGAPFSIVPLIESVSHNPLPGALGIAQAATQITALILLFQHNSSEWFKAMQRPRRKA